MKTAYKEKLSQWPAEPARLPDNTASNAENNTIVFPKNSRRTLLENIFLIKTIIAEEVQECLP